MKKQDHITPPKVHNSSINESKDIEMPDKDFKSLVFKVANKPSVVAHICNPNSFRRWSSEELCFEVNRQKVYETSS
jgi:hypothetical protein